MCGLQVRETSRTSPLSPKNLITRTKTAEQVKKDFSDVVLPGQLHNQVGGGWGDSAAGCIPCGRLCVGWVGGWVLGPVSGQHLGLCHMRLPLCTL